MPEAVSPAILDLLTWLSSRPRTYDETMAAWRTHCPRLSIWEDALADGLVQVVRGGDGRASTEVTLTARGRAALELTPTRSSTVASS
jgi:hypothetical protein